MGTTFGASSKLARSTALDSWLSVRFKARDTRNDVGELGELGVFGDTSVGSAFFAESTRPAWVLPEKALVGAGGGPMGGGGTPPVSREWTHD